MATDESGFAVFRHGAVSVAGVVPAEAAEQQRIHGWYRVSDWAPGSTFDLDTFGEDLPDLDEPPPKLQRKSRAKPEPDETEPVDEADADEMDEE